MRALEGVTLAFFAGFKPPPKLSLSQWADEYFYLSAESSADAGKWHTLPYQKGIMDAISDDGVEEVWVQKSARIGYTKIANAAIGYYIHQDPCPVMMVQPAIEDAEGYSKEEIAPMIDDVPVLRAIAPIKKAKGSKETILHKVFKNKASLSMVGANSPRGFRRVSRRVVIFDETDGYPASAGAEGDQIALGKRRAEYYANRKIIGGSTPTIKDVSRIEREVGQTDQRRFFVPCPQCGEFQYFKWGGPDLPYGFKWTNHDPQTVFYLCEHCACPIEPKWKRWMVERGEWRPTAPARVGALGRQKVGFLIWAAYSYSPNASWPHLVEEFIEARPDPEKFQTWVNTVLGETWDPHDSESGKAEGLLARRERYAAPVPAGVAVLVAGIDTQDDRLEICVWGFGRSGEVWLVLSHEIYGNLVTDEPWLDLEALLDRDFQHEAGVIMRIRAACIDTGGHLGKYVHAFAKRRRRCATYAIAGATTRLDKPVKRSKGKNSRLWLVDTIAIKDIIFGRLKVERPADWSAPTPVPYHLHFPSTVDKPFFDQLTGERAVTRRQAGQDRRIYEKVRPGNRVEKLDCTVYAFAALDLLYPKDQGQDLEPPPMGTSQAVVDQVPTLARTRRIRSQGIN